MPNPRQRPQIGFEYLGLGTILRRHELFVPQNQREFAWKANEHVEQLYQDYFDAITNGDEHFLGTIVTIPSNGTRLEVVDGQQRLATTSLLLAAMRDRLTDTADPIYAERINTYFLYGISGGERVPRLALNLDDNNLYRAIAAGEELPEAVHSSNRLLLAAYKQAQAFVKNLLAAVDEKSIGEFLDRWVDFIEFNALVVLLQVPDESDAYTMFETLNDRGLRVSQADLVKNHLYGNAGNRLGEVQASWRYMRGAIDSLDDPEITVNFLRHALVLLRGYISSKEVFHTVESIARREQTTVTLATHLEQLSAVYVATFNPEHERWNGYPQATRRAIEVFNLLDIKPLRALLLAVGARMDAQEASKSFADLISLGVRLLVAATIRSGSVEAPLSLTAKDVFDGTIKTADALRERLAPMMPSDAQFKEAFTDARVTKAVLARYYLRSLEEAARRVSDPWLIPESDPLVISLEHVLPQRPEDNWPDISPEDAEQYGNRVGNLALMLTKDNSDLKSASFEVKREVYAKSPFELTSQIATLKRWTPIEIEERQRMLADLAIKTWPRE